MYVIKRLNYVLGVYINSHIGTRAKALAPANMAIQCRYD